MLNATIDGESVRRAIAELKAVEPGALSALKKDLTSQLSNLSQNIVSDIPVEAPLSGMAESKNYGRLRWGQVQKAKIGLTPGRSRRGGMKALVSIRVTMNPDAGYQMAELAGSRTKGYQASGKMMIQKLNERFPWKGKAGRFAFRKFREVRPEVIVIATRILNEYLEQVNRRIT
jgi:hypothetical protein